MKNVIFVTKVDGIVYRKYFLDVNKIVSVSLPIDGVFQIYFNAEEYWNILDEEFDYVMHYWHTEYKQMYKYKNYLEDEH